jgi:uncharacterized repeat protein (TIGR01451 family)
MSRESIARLGLAALVALAGVLIATPAAAQFHGVQLQGVCTVAKPGDNPTCTLRVANTADTFLDDIEVQEAWMVYDAVTIANPGGDAVRDPLAGNLPITGFVGAPVCAPGPVLPCVLAPGEAVDFESNGYTAQPDDPDPLPIRGFARSRDICNGNFDPSCNPNAIDEAGISLASDLFQPEIAISKTPSSQLGKVGDTIDYTITLSNNSSGDTPAISCIVVDSLLGDISNQFPDPLPLGDSQIVVQRQIQGGDPNPVVNSVSASCSIEGFANVLDDASDASVDLFEPAIDVTKAADVELAKVGDTVTYTITLFNNSTGAVPPLDCVATDSLLGEVFNAVLPLGDTVIVIPRDVQGGDPDPLVNSVDLDCNVRGFPNQLNASDEATVDLFDVAIDLTKAADVELAKVGDTVTYTLTASNNSSADAPALSCTLTDTLLGPIVIADPLPLGDTAIVIPRDVQGGDPDPLVNEATLDCAVAGFPNQLSASDEATVDLFGATISLSKTADVQAAKVGDTVGYTITLSNNSSGDTPDITCSVNDTLLGDISGEFPSPLPLGDSVANLNYIVQGGDPNPLINLVTANCSIEGFPNQLGDEAQVSVDIFDPAIDVTKTADPLVAKVGDTIDYTITLSNISSAGTPDLNCTATDSLLGVVFAGVLPAGDTVIPIARNVQGGDPNPLVNTVDLDCTVDGFPNQLNDSDSASVDLLAPALSLSKTCAPPVITTGEDITWTITVNNDGDTDLECLVNDATAGYVDEPVNLGPFSSSDLIASRATVPADEPLLSNTATVECAIGGGALPNVLRDEATADCEVQPPGDAICRTPGFWGTHAGTEKKNSSDLTQIVIDAAGGSLSVCGEVIDTTAVPDTSSAVEAICVSIKGEQRLQLARQLTALALNCVISGGGADCGGTEQSTLFADANAACIANSGDLSSWIEDVDAVNNGAWDDCHDRELSESDVFDGVAKLPGPAGSSNKCNSATSNSVNIFQ